MAGYPGTVSSPVEESMRWEVQTDNGWCPYDDKVNADLLKAKGTPVEFEIAAHKYRVTFSSDVAARQTNLTTQKHREVRLAPTEGGQAKQAEWQVLLSGSWQSLDRDVQNALNRGARRGNREVSFTYCGERYRADLLDMQQLNLRTGRERPLRYTGDQPPLAAKSTLFRKPSSSCQDGGEGSRYQIFVEGGWRNMPASQTALMNEYKAKGQLVFTLELRNFKYKINLRDLTQTNLKTGTVRDIRCLGASASTSGDPGSASAAEIGAFFDACAQGSETLRPSEASERWLHKALTGVQGSERDQAKQLVSLGIKKTFEQMSLRTEDAVSKDEWIHFWLLLPSAPSAHAVDIVQEGLRASRATDLGQLTALFVEAEKVTASDAEISPEALVEAAKKYMGKFSGMRGLFHRPAFPGAASLATTSNKRTQDDDSTINYFEFVSAFLGRPNHEVWIYQYDISDGKAAWLAPVLLGQKMEGIWHTGVVVFGKEYWYGGELFESVPGDTPFGTPVKKVRIGTTVCTRRELWTKIETELCREYTPDTYDVLTNNCNNFSDDVTMFLMNKHIPDEVRMQPEKAMSAVTVKMLRPLLNRCLGGFAEAIDGMKEARAAGEQAVEKKWADVKVGSLVTFARDGLPMPVVAEVLHRGDVTCDLWWWEPRGHMPGSFEEVGDASKMQVAGTGDRTSRETPRRAVKRQGSEAQGCVVT